MIERIKPLEMCCHCQFYRQTGFTIDDTQPTHWQKVRRHGVCESVENKGTQLATYTSDYNRRDHYKEEVKDEKRDMQ